MGCWRASRWRVARWDRRMACQTVCALGDCAAANGPANGSGAWSSRNRSCRGGKRVAGPTFATMAHIWSTLRLARKSACAAFNANRQQVATRSCRIPILMAVKAFRLMYCTSDKGIWFMALLSMVDGAVVNCAWVPWRLDRSASRCKRFLMNSRIGNLWPVRKSRHAFATCNCRPLPRNDWVIADRGCEARIWSSGEVPGQYIDIGGTLSFKGANQRGDPRTCCDWPATVSRTCRDTVTLVAEPLFRSACVRQLFPLGAGEVDHLAADRLEVRRTVIVFDLLRVVGHGVDQRIARKPAF